jgi:hypothetical protein
MTTSQGVNWIRGTRRPTASVGDTNSKVVPGLIADSTSRSTRRTNLGWVKCANGSVAVSPAARYRRPEQWSLVICESSVASASPPVEAGPHWRKVCGVWLAEPEGPI